MSARCGIYMHVYMCGIYTVPLRHAPSASPTLLSISSSSANHVMVSSRSSHHTPSNGDVYSSMASNTATCHIPVHRKMPVSHVTCHMPSHRCPPILSSFLYGMSRTKRAACAGESRQRSLTMGVSSVQESTGV